MSRYYRCLACRVVMVDENMKDHINRSPNHHFVEEVDRSEEGDGDG